MVSKSSSLVRPRTVMQESNQSKQRNRRSILVLSLCGACLFLLIICSALIAALVFVGKNLSSQSHHVGLSSSSSSIDNNSNNTAIINGIRTTSDNNFNKNQLTIKSGERNRARIPAMKTPKLSKIVDQLRWRLPSEIRPILYTLHLHPDLKTKTFTGNVSIQLQITKPINYIALHSKKLTISQTILERNASSLGTADGSGGRQLQTVPIWQTFDHPEFEYWITEVEKPLDVGDYVLALTFNGSLTDRIVGFYQSSYFDKQKNETRYFILI